MTWESLGATDGEVEIVEYRDEWASVFEKESRRILEACEGPVVKVEHIGSTAIPDLIAKPILDVMLGLSLSKDERIVEPMMNLGYEFLGEYGIPGRSYFILRSSGRQVVHVHAFAITDDHWGRHLSFRDHLRRDSAARRQYAELKRELAERFPQNRDAYANAKTDFIRSIERAAKNLPIKMRPATVEDLDFLVDVFLSAGREMITASRGGWDAAHERAQFEEQLDLSSTRIIQSGDLDVGFVMVVPKDEDVELHTICVLPEYQGLGIGSQVTNEVVQLAVDGGRGVILSVLKENKRARALYKRLGFVVIGASKHHHHMRFSEP